MTGNLGVRKKLGNSKKEKKLTFQHLNSNSGARGGFLDAEGGCFHHLTERPSSQWVPLGERQP